MVPAVLHRLPVEAHPPHPVDLDDRVSERCKTFAAAISRAPFSIRNGATTAVGSMRTHPRSATQTSSTHGHRTAAGEKTVDGFSSPPW